MVVEDIDIVLFRPRPGLVPDHLVGGGPVEHHGRRAAQAEKQIALPPVRPVLAHRLDVVQMDWVVDKSRRPRRGDAASPLSIRICDTERFINSLPSGVTMAMLSSWNFSGLTP